MRKLSLSVIQTQPLTLQHVWKPYSASEPETGLTESWEYDSQGRLKSATAGSMRYEYSYDANNRLIEVQYPHILGNLKDGNTAFEKLSYDKVGNRTLRVT